uniref:Protein kinase domain-containing protein n=1 Tax=Kalanchoe fedtschenkoi TaxID=63787 RepID=A0A7N0TSJ8_KALFE
PAALPRAVNLSGTPFRVSSASCSRLHLLRPCPDPDLPNCFHCPWECQLIHNPARILPSCGSPKNRPDPEQGCQADVISYLDSLLLRFGFEIEWDEDPNDAYFPSCRRCQASGGVCGFDSSDPDNPFLCFRRESAISPPWIRRHSPNLVISAIFVVVTLVALIAVAALKFRSLKRKLADELSEDPTTLFLRRQRSASLLPPVFTYDDLELATGKFDSRRKIGDGGFGSVYRAQLSDGRVVAVKRLHRQSSDSAAVDTYFTKSFCNEILILSSIEHPHMVKLHGYCSDPRGLLLVYDYVPNGTLADHLHSQRRSTLDQTLTWQVRLEIAIQVATAIEYLHFSVKPPVVHRDITSSNIFVESDMRVKVGDFGLSRLMSGPGPAGSGPGVVVTGPQGTPGYLDPDYHNCFRLTEKSDVYSFGVVLMELITGKRAVDERRERREAALADLVVVRIQMGRLREVVDPGLVSGGEVVDGVGAVAELAFRCVAADKDDRPDMAEVAAELRRISGRSCASRHSCSDFDVAA